MESRSIHDYSIQGNKGDVLQFSAYKARKILLVNVASECGLTPQYAQLEALYQAAQGKMIIVGCPSNDFGQQEPGTDAEIAQFCSLNYGISFPLTTKIKVKKGDGQHELYQYLTQKTLNGLSDADVTWNFQKYIFDETGQLTHVFGPQTEPLDAPLLEALDVQMPA